MNRYRSQMVGTMTQYANGKLLFVDDEESILDIATEYFRLRGYDVVTARNGVEALQIMETERFDCCFTDINMPEMDGLALAEHIRTFDNTVPVVVMTGYPSLENTIKTLKNGVVDFLIKPVNLKQMELCVRRVLRERRLFIENIILREEVEGKARLEALNRELQDKLDDLNLLNRIMSEFATPRSSAEVFQKVVDTAVEITHADGARFFVVNEGMPPLEIAASAAASSAPPSAGDGSPEPQALEKPEGVCDEGTAPPLLAAKLLAEIHLDRKPLLITENRGIQDLPRSVRSFVGVPLTIRDRVFGVLTAVLERPGTRFNEKDLYYLSFLTNKAAYAVENLALYENIYENLFSTLYAFVKAIEARDPYTEQHSNRVTGIAIAVGKEMGCSAEEIDILNVSGLLHDIGKIGIRDDILLKPGSLTSEEFSVIMDHPEIGARIVGQLGLWGREQVIIRSHHERFDGSGYPDGLKGEAIPQLARILAVADSYDAMASDRAYRKRMEEGRILKIITGASGTQFDPAVVSVFQRLHCAGEITRSSAAFMTNTPV
ncbi:MAG: response regulator [Desulfobacterales bacterium]|nr:response regulator [Desulfobacterales bacterium]